MQHDAYESLWQLFSKTYFSYNYLCMFKIKKLESKCCSDYGKTASNDGVGINWSLHFENLNIFQAIGGILLEFLDPRGEYLKFTDMQMDVRC